MKTFASFLLSILFVVNLGAQTLKQNIQEIRTQFKWINSQKDFEKVVFENTEFAEQPPSEGCGLEVYYKGDNLYKMIESDIASTSIYTTEFYFKNNKLIFVYRKEEDFVRIPGSGHSDTEIYYEERVYYKNDTIIRHLEDGLSVLDKPLDYQELSKEYVKYFTTKVIYEKQYNMLQGTWIPEDENDDDWFEIIGLRTDYYNRDNPYKEARMWFDGRYLWFHTTSYPEEDRKWEVLELTDKKLKVQDRLTGAVITYNKNVG